MRVLRNDSLCDALMRCYDYKNYKVSIVFDTLEDAGRFAKELYEIHAANHIPGIDKVCSGAGRFRVNFKNGSRLQLVYSVEDIRGNRCNEILYQDKIDIENINMRRLLSSMLVEYKTESVGFMDGHPTTEAARIKNVLTNYERYEDARQYSEELDEYLNSFVITS